MRHITVGNISRTAFGEVSIADISDAKSTMTFTPVCIENTEYVRVTMVGSKFNLLNDRGGTSHTIALTPEYMDSYTILTEAHRTDDIDEAIPDWWTHFYKLVPMAVKEIIKTDRLFSLQMRAVFDHIYGYTLVKTLGFERTVSESLFYRHPSKQATDVVFRVMEGSEVVPEGIYPMTMTFQGVLKCQIDKKLFKQSTVSTDVACETKLQLTVDDALSLLEVIESTQEVFKGAPLDDMSYAIPLSWIFKRTIEAGKPLSLKAHAHYDPAYSYSSYITRPVDIEEVMDHNEDGDLVPFEIEHPVEEWEHDFYGTLEFKSTADVYSPAVGVSVFVHMATTYTSRESFSREEPFFIPNKINHKLPGHQQRDYTLWDLRYAVMTEKYQSLVSRISYSLGDSIPMAFEPTIRMACILIRERIECAKISGEFKKLQFTGISTLRQILEEIDNVSNLATATAAVVTPIRPGSVYPVSDRLVGSSGPVATFSDVAGMHHSVRVDSGVTLPYIPM